jgi:uncharacterized iron-regulated protein
MRFPWLGLLTGTALTLSAAFSIVRGAEPTAEAVAKHYADMAEAMYGDAHAAARSRLSGASPCRSSCRR